VKPWIFVILAVIALGVVFNDPEHKAEGSSVMTSVSDAIDPYLQQTFSDSTHERIEQHSQEAAEFVRQTGEDFGIELTFESDR
jgi:hypothetical protein